MRNQGHILTDDIVVNYRNNDRDDSLHFLTHLDTSCKELSMIISPTAKRIYTSIFNSWFLKANFNVKHIDVQGFGTNKSYKITYKGNKYIYSFLDSKFTTGSVALLLHGPFGTYLYTGNFCYYPSFVKSPVLLPVIEEKALTRLYLDNTYYEQPSSFYGFDELANKVAELIRSEPHKNVYIYADKVSMDPLLAEVASKVKEKVYVCQSTMEIMKILGYSDFFTRSADSSRIFIDKAFLKKRGYDRDNIVIYFNRFTESCKEFRQFEKRGNVYNFFFYCHSNHREICELLTILKPESMTFLFSEIDKSKITYNLDFNNDILQTTLFKSVSDSRSSSCLNSERDCQNKNQICPKSISKSQNDYTASISEDSKDLHFNELVSNYTSPKEDLPISTNFMKDNKCPLRIRKVPEINNSGLCIQSNSSENVCRPVQYVPVSNSNNEGFSYETVKDSGGESNMTINHMNEVILPSSEKLHNYCKPKQSSNPSVKVVNISSVKNDSLPETSLIPSSETKVIHKRETVYKHTGVPFRINRKLLNEGHIASSKQFLKLSNIGLVPISKKKTIVIQKKNIDSMKPNMVEMSTNYTHNNAKVNIMDNKNMLIQKNHLIPVESQNSDTPLFLNLKQIRPLNQPCAIGTKHTPLFHSLTKEKTGMHNSSTSEISVESILLSSNNSSEFKNSSSEVCNEDINKTKTSFEQNEVCKSTNSFDSMKDSLDHVDSESNDNTTKNRSDDSSSNSIVVKTSNNSSTTVASKSQYYMDNPSKPTEIKIINENPNNKNQKVDAKHCMKDDIIKPCSKRTLPDVDDSCANSRKKLRSENFNLCLLQPNISIHAEEANLKECSVELRKDEVEKTYFFSSYHNCHLPKFLGFKKHQVRPRHVLCCLRNLEKYIERSFT